MDKADFEKIEKVASWKEVWEIMEIEYRGNNRVKQVLLQTLNEEFENLNMEDKERVIEYITQVGMKNQYQPTRLWRKSWDHR